MISRIKDFIIKKIISIIKIADKADKKISLAKFSSRSEINIHPSYSNLSAENFKGKGNVTGKIIIGEYFIIRDYCNFLVYPEAELKIGDRVFFNNYCSVNCLEKIHIGDDTIFGEGVKIYDHNHLIEKEDVLKYSKEEFTKSPVIIGKNCWIASNVTILKGVKIGDNCIIGAGCVIHKSIPANSLVKNQQNLIIDTIL